LDASCPRDVTGKCQNEEAGMKGSGNVIVAAEVEVVNDRLEV